MRFSEETYIFGGLVLAVFAVAIAGFVYDYNKNQQIRVMYQQVYQKSMECRVAYVGKDPRYIDSVCGAVPKFEDYKTND